MNSSGSIMSSTANITLRQLRVFLAVAELRNFSRAGDRMGLTQPAVSRIIHELESQVGLALVNRTTRLVELTQAGRSLAAKLERPIDDLELALGDIQDLTGQRRGTVRVGSSPTLSAQLMPACIAESARRWPDLRLQLLDRVQQDVLASVRAGEVDFAAVIEPQDTQDLDTEVIQHDPFVLVCRADHPLARHRSLNWQRLDGQPLVLLDHASGSRRLIDQSLAQQGIAAEVVQELGHVTTAFRMVEAGLGVSVLPGLVAPDLGSSQTLVVRPLLPRVERRIMLVRRRHRALSPMAADIWQLVAGLAARSQAPSQRQPSPP